MGINTQMRKTNSRGEKHGVRGGLGETRPPVLCFDEGKGSKTAQRKKGARAKRKNETVFLVSIQSADYVDNFKIRDRVGLKRRQGKGRVSAY